MLPSGLSRQKKILTPELAKLLDSIPIPALLISNKSAAVKKSAQILRSNPQFYKLTGLSETTLENSALDGLIPGYDLRNSSTKIVQIKRNSYLSVDNSPIKINSMKHELSDDLFILYFIDDILQEKTIKNESDHLIDVWLRASRISDTTNLAFKLEAVLAPISMICGSSGIAVYLASSSQPQFEQIAAYGNVNCLPKIFNSHEIALENVLLIKSQELWLPGKRTNTRLFKAARDGSLSYIQSVPIGQQNAFIGFIAIAGINSPPHPKLQAIAEHASAMVESIILRSNLQDEIQKTERINLNQKQLFQAILNNCHEGIIILSPNLRIVSFNPAAETILGYNRAEVTGQSVDNVLIGSESFLSELHHGLPLNQPYESTTRFYRRKGQAFFAHFKLIALQGDYLTDLLPKIDSLDGVEDDHYFTIIFQDLTELEEIRLKTLQLEQQAILGEITAVFAHEVRNPINNISTGLELISLNLPTNDPNQDTILRLLQDCDRLADLMKSVLSYSRTTEYTMAALAPGPFLQNILDRMNTRLERVNVQAVLQIEDGCPPVRGNARALEQVFTNLFNNAAQAMSDFGGKIVIQAKKSTGENRYTTSENTVPDGTDDRKALSTTQNNYVEISVTDTGPGIPVDIQDKIFQPFYSLNNSSGTGLGLAIAKRIITAHKGNIRIISIPGGTIFSVSLPISDLKPGS